MGVCGWVFVGGLGVDIGFWTRGVWTGVGRGMGMGDCPGGGVAECRMDGKLGGGRG